jgi:hypothetical protein
MTVTDRKVAINPTLRYTLPDYAGIAKAYDKVGDSFNRAANSIGDAARAISAAMETSARREADSLHTDYLRGGREAINGKMEYDENGKPTGKSVGGIVDKQYDPNNKDISPITDFAEWERSFFESDKWKNASSSAKEKFRERIQVDQQRFFEAVNGLYDRNKMTWAKIEKTRADGESDNKAQASFFSELHLFNYASQESSIEKAVRAMGSAVKNPEVIYKEGFDESEIEFAHEDAKKAYHELVRQNLKDYDSRRMNEIFAAAKGGTDVNGMTSEDLLALAEEGIEQMKGQEEEGIIYTKPEIEKYQRDLAAARAEIAERRNREKIARNGASMDKFTLELSDFQTDLNDPRMNPLEIKMDLDGFTDRVDADENLTPLQRNKLIQDYGRMVKYQKKYSDDLEAFKKEAAEKGAAADAQFKSTHGFIDEDGVFNPASAFPQKSDPATIDEFSTELSPIWADPKTALLKIKAAKMVGRLSVSDYKMYTAHAAMLMDEKAQAAWLKLFPKVNLGILTKIGYGTDEKTEEQKNAYRKFTASYGKDFGGIYAKTRGNAGRKSTVDWLNDSLEKDDTEELITADVLTKVYDTVRRFARAGIDPEEAIRQIIAPTIASGIERRLDERLTSEDYMLELMDKTSREGGEGIGLGRAVHNELSANRSTWNADIGHLQPVKIKGVDQDQPQGVDTFMKAAQDEEAISHSPAYGDAE